MSKANDLITPAANPAQPEAMREKKTSSSVLKVTRHANECEGRSGDDFNDGGMNVSAGDAFGGRMLSSDRDVFEHNA
ncbi:hypothetical protein IWW45_009362, partial [Coemansia sp. RSA 485]